MKVASLLWRVFPTRVINGRFTRIAVTCLQVLRVFSWKYLGCSPGLLSFTRVGNSLRQPRLGEETTPLGPSVLNIVEGVAGQRSFLISFYGAAATGQANMNRRAEWVGGGLNGHERVMKPGYSQ